MYSIIIFAHSHNNLCNLTPPLKSSLCKHIQTPLVENRPTVEPMSPKANMPEKVNEGSLKSLINHKKV